MAYYRLHQESARMFCLKLHSDDGGLLLDCMSASSWVDAMTDLSNIRSLAPFETRYARVSTASDEHSFLIRDYNDREVAKSGTYSTTAARDAAIELCQKFGGDAKLVDETSENQTARP